MADAANSFYPDHVLSLFAQGIAPMDKLLPPLGTSVYYHQYTPCDIAATLDVNEIPAKYRRKSHIDEMYLT